MSDLMVVMDAAEARRLTDRVKGRLADAWADLLTLYEGQAHIALGYSSWGAYYEAEVGQAGSRGYHLLDAARVRALLAGSTDVEQVTEAQAREMAPLMRTDPAAVPVVYQKAQERSGGTPTAAAVRQAVRDWIDDGKEVERRRMAQVTDEQRARFSPERMRQQGELMRLMRDLAALPEPRAYAREHDDLPARAIEDALAAYAWLDTFMNEWKEMHR